MEKSISRKLLSACLVFVLCIITVFVDVQYASAETDFTGYTPISSKEDLDSVRRNPSGNYYLTCDIVFTEDDFAENGDYYNNGIGWIPINEFSGIFNGNGYAIIGMQLKGEQLKGNSGGGLFALNKGTIENLGLEKGIIELKSTSSSLSVGAIATYNHGTISNCYNASKIAIKSSGNVSVGGIACYNGGIIEYCYNLGNITVNASRYESETGCDVEAGGICASSDSEVRYCYNVGDLNIYVESKGGTSYLYGKYNANAQAYVGGCVNGGYVQNCYNIGYIDVTSKANVRTSSANSEAYAYVGGISGYIDNFNIENCYNVGEILCESKATNMYNEKDSSCVNESYIGGVAGIRKGTGEIKYAYYLDVCNQGVGNSDNEAIEMSALQLQQQSNMVGFDFANTWTYEDEEKYAYPTLKNNKHIGHIIPPIPLGSAVTDDGRFCYNIITFESGETVVRVLRYLGCEEEVIIPNTIEGYTVYSIEDGAFEDARIKKVTSETASIIGFSAFKNCTRLKKVEFPNVRQVYSNDYNWVGGKLIANNAFENCKRIEEIELPSVEYINAYTFLGCNRLNTVVLPSLEIVWPHAFNLKMNEDGSRPKEKSDIENLYLSCRGVSYSAGVEKYQEHIRTLHAWGNWTESKEATCNVKGEETRTCGACGSTETRETTVDLTAHAWGNWTKVDDSNHQRICSNDSNHVETAAHSWGTGALTQEPTCTETGVKTYTCSVCGATKTETINALTHNLVHHDAQAGTCTEIGWNAYDTCSRCDYTTYVEIAATGHTEVVDTAVPATCTETGLTEGKHCSVCDAVLVAQTVADALGHDIVIDEAVAATCTETGLTRGEHCTRCDYKVAQTVVPATGHNYESDRCIVCGETKPGLPSGGGGVILPPIPPTQDTDKEDSKEIIINEKTDTEQTTIVRPESQTEKTEDGKVYANTELNKDISKEMVENAVANNSDKIVIQVKPEVKEETVSVSEVKLPLEAIKAIAEETEVEFVLETHQAEITFDSKAMEAIAEQAKGDTVSIVAEIVAEEHRTDEQKTAVGDSGVVIELKVMHSDGSVSKFNGGKATVVMLVPDDMHGKNIKALYLGTDGTYTVVPGKKIMRDGKEYYEFTTGHFSSYVLVEEDSADKLISQQNEKFAQITKGVEATTLKLQSSVTKKGTVRLSWKKSKGYKVDYYQVFRSAKKGTFGTKAFYVSSNGTKNYYINTKDLKTGKRYYYKVRGGRIVDGKKYYTKWSNVASRVAA